MQFEQNSVSLLNLFSIRNHQRWHVQHWATLCSGHIFSEQGLLRHSCRFDKKWQYKVAQATTMSYKGQANLSYVPLYFLMPCICSCTTVRGHHIQRYFLPLTTQATFSPERLLSLLPSTLRTTFPLIESVSKAIAKESSESEICSQLSISRVE